MMGILPYINFLLLSELLKPKGQTIKTSLQAWTIKQPFGVSCLTEQVLKGVQCGGVNNMKMMSKKPQ